MISFRALSIGRKLAVIGLATVGLALLLNSVASLAASVVIVRRAVFADIVAQSAMLADNAAAAVAFDDQATVETTLALLREKTAVDAACLFNGIGHLFASYGAPGRPTVCPSSPPPDGTTVSLATVRDVTPMAISGRRVGTVFVQGNYDQVWDQLRAQALGAMVGLVLAAAGALLLMRRLHRTLIDPITHLSAVASQVSAGQDYALRATKYTSDEIGSLVDDFNRMLARMQAHDARLSKANLDLSHEIVERQRIENERSTLLVREREANRLKDEFLAAVSHELRTPLNAILGWAQLLEHPGVGGDTTTQGLASIHRNARAQARIIDDLLDISRIVSGKVHLKAEPVDVASAVTSAVDVMKSAAGAKAIEVSVTGHTQCTVLADPERLQQILWNLVSNAVKFTPQGGRVDVTFRALGGECTIDVSDTGAGIAPEFLPHVFDRFRQADGSLTREHGGLGLGLAIVNELVELHGGTVSASSEGLGRGARFTVRLPLAKEALLPAPAAASPSISGSLAGVRVLVVDDDADARNIAATALRGAGADVVAVGTPRQALDQTADPAAFAVLVCDIGMQGMDGYDVIRRIREREAGTGQRLHAIAMTAYASAEDVRRATAAGFDAHVAKPVAIPDLLRTVAAARKAPRAGA